MMMNVVERSRTRSRIRGESVRKSVPSLGVSLSHSTASQILEEGADGQLAMIHYRPANRGTLSIGRQTTCLALLSQPSSCAVDCCLCLVASCFVPSTCVMTLAKPSLDILNHSGQGLISMAEDQTSLGINHQFYSYCLNNFFFFESLQTTLSHNDASHEESCKIGR